MIISRDMEALAEGREVLVWLHTKAGTVRVLARLAWFEEGGQTRRLALQSTWDGAAMPEGWTPFAWADPGEADVADDVL